MGPVENPSEVLERDEDIKLAYNNINVNTSVEIAGTVAKFIKYAGFVFGKLFPGWGSLIGAVGFSVESVAAYYKKEKTLQEIRTIVSHADENQDALRASGAQITVSVPHAENTWSDQLGLQNNGFCSKANSLALLLSFTTIASQLATTCSDGAIALSEDKHILLNEQQKKGLVILSIITGFLVLFIPDERAKLERRNQSRERFKAEWRGNSLDLLLHQSDNKSKRVLARHMQRVIEEKKASDEQPTQERRPELDNPPLGAKVEVQSEEQVPLTERSKPRTTLTTLIKAPSTLAAVFRPSLAVNRSGQQPNPEAINRPPSLTDD